MRSLSRRGFIVLGVTAGGGLLVTSRLPFGGAEDPRFEGPATRFGPFLEITPGNQILVTVPVPEIGQGVRTSLAMLVAEELDAEWDQLEVLQADAASDLGPHPMAGGSWSVRAYWEPLRHLGAVTRDLLVRAAAAQWGADPGECTSGASRVRHLAAGREVTFGAVAAAAALLQPRTDLALRPATSWRLLGTPRAGVDVPEIVSGRRIYGLDVRRPQMRFAVILRSPVFGGTLRRFDSAAALAVRGVETVIEVGPIGRPEAPTVAHGVAVIATNTWAAIEGRRLLTAEWDPGPNATASTAALREECLRIIGRDASVYRESGRIDDGGSGTIVSARYHLPFLAHATMEPPV